MLTDSRHYFDKLVLAKSVKVRLEIEQPTLYHAGSVM